MRGWSRGDTIGRGSSATVSIATDVISGATFAVKSAELKNSGRLRREFSILAFVSSSPHVVRCMGNDVTCEGGKKFYNLFMEYFPCGTISDEIRRQGGLPEGEIRRHTSTLLRGLCDLHGMGTVHCDIKGSNLLIGEDGEVKIGDLGCAKHAGDVNAGREMAGTLLFMAPEVARGESQLYAADVWSLGCTVVEMATGRPPWAGIADGISLLYQIGCSNAVPDIPENLSDEGKNFLSRCFRRNPGERWTAEKLLQHSFVLDFALREKRPSTTTPKSILDQHLWSTSQEMENTHVEIASSCNSTSLSAAERLGPLVSPANRRPAWSWNENWLHVRRINGPDNSPTTPSWFSEKRVTEDLDACSTSVSEVDDDEPFRGEDGHDDTDVGEDHCDQFDNSGRITSNSDFVKNVNNLNCSIQQQPIQPSSLSASLFSILHRGGIAACPGFHSESKCFAPNAAG